jgi:hypothetical protein
MLGDYDDLLAQFLNDLGLDEIWELDDVNANAVPDGLEVPNADATVPALDLDAHGAEDGADPFFQLQQQGVPGEQVAATSASVVPSDPFTQTEMETDADRFVDARMDRVLNSVHDNNLKAINVWGS